MKKYRKSRNFPRQTDPKICVKCGPPALPDKMFGQSPYHSEGRQPICRVCIHKKKNNRDGKYTGHDYLRIEKEQGGHCKFYDPENPCENSGKRNTGLHIDHNHNIGKMRRLLCHYHNRRVVGMFDKLTDKEIYALLEYTGKWDAVLNVSKNAQSD